MYLKTIHIEVTKDEANVLKELIGGAIHDLKNDSEGTPDGARYLNTLERLKSKLETI